jgi:hypothetical protein
MKRPRPDGGAKLMKDGTPEENAGTALSKSWLRRITPELNARITSSSLSTRLTGAVTSGLGDKPELFFAELRAAFRLLR